MPKHLILLSTLEEAPDQQNDFLRRVLVELREAHCAAKHASAPWAGTALRLPTWLAAASDGQTLFRGQGASPWIVLGPGKEIPAGEAVPQASPGPDVDVLESMVGFVGLLGDLVSTVGPDSDLTVLWFARAFAGVQGWSEREASASDLLQRCRDALGPERMRALVVPDAPMEPSWVQVLERFLSCSVLEPPSAPPQATKVMGSPLGRDGDTAAMAQTPSSGPQGDFSTLSQRWAGTVSALSAHVGITTLWAGPLRFPAKHLLFRRGQGPPVAVRATLAAPGAPGMPASQGKGLSLSRKGAGYYQAEPLDLEVVSFVRALPPLTAGALQLHVAPPPEPSPLPAKSREAAPGAANGSEALASKARNEGRADGTGPSGARMAFEALRALQSLWHDGDAQGDPCVAGLVVRPSRRSEGLAGAQSRAATVRGATTGDVSRCARAGEVRGKAPVAPVTRERDRYDASLPYMLLTPVLSRAEREVAGHGWWDGKEGRRAGDENCGETLTFAVSLLPVGFSAGVGDQGRGTLSVDLAWAWAMEFRMDPVSCLRNKLHSLGKAASAQVHVSPWEGGRGEHDATMLSENWLEEGGVLDALRAASGTSGVAQGLGLSGSGGLLWGQGLEEESLEMARWQRGIVGLVRHWDATAAQLHAAWEAMLADGEAASRADAQASARTSAGGRGGAAGMGGASGRTTTGKGQQLASVSDTLRGSRALTVSRTLVPGPPTSRDGLGRNREGRGLSEAVAVGRQRGAGPGRGANGAASVGARQETYSGVGARGSRHMAGLQSAGQHRVTERAEKNPVEQVMGLGLGEGGGVRRREVGGAGDLVGAQAQSERGGVALGSVPTDWDMEGSAGKAPPQPLVSEDCPPTQAMECPRASETGLDGCVSSKATPGSKRRPVGDWEQEVTSPLKRRRVGTQETPGGQRRGDGKGEGLEAVAAGDAGAQGAVGAGGKGAVSGERVGVREGAGVIGAMVDGRGRSNAGATASGAPVIDNADLAARVGTEVGVPTANEQGRVKPRDGAALRRAGSRGRAPARPGVADGRVAAAAREAWRGLWPEVEDDILADRGRQAGQSLQPSPARVLSAIGRLLTDVSAALRGLEANGVLLEALKGLDRGKARGPGTGERGAGRAGAVGRGQRRSGEEPGPSPGLWRTRLPGVWGLVSAVRRELFPTREDLHGRAAPVLAGCSPGGQGWGAGLGDRDVLRTPVKTTPTQAAVPATPLVTPPRRQAGTPLRRTPVRGAGAGDIHQCTAAWLGLEGEAELAELLTELRRVCALASSGSVRDMSPAKLERVRGQVSVRLSQALGLAGGGGAAAGRQGAKAPRMAVHDSKATKPRRVWRGEFQMVQKTVQAQKQSSG